MLNEKNLFISDETLNEVLTLRYKKMRKTEKQEETGKQKKNTVSYSRKVILLTAVIAVLLIGGVVIAMRKAPSAPIPISGYDTTIYSGITEAADMQTTAAQPNDSDVTSAVGPEETEIYTSPTLNELYRMEPYSELLPKKILPSFEFLSSYLVSEPDGKYLGHGVHSSEPKSFLAVYFREKGLESNPAYSFDVRVNDFKEDSRLADPNDPSTYELQPYYDAVNEGTLPKDLPDVSGLFYAEDITKEIVSAKICTILGGLRKAEIGIVCGEYVVSYGYVGPDISADDFYDMITSSTYFEEMLSEN